MMRYLLFATVTFWFSFLSVFSVSDSSVAHDVQSPVTFDPTVPCVSTSVMYGIVFDAGSTGTRIHVYTFHLDSTGSYLEIDGEIFESLKPGLSAFAEQPEKGAESVRSLLRLAEDNIPPIHWKTTPLLLKATAGLRLLPAHQAEALLLEVRKVFSSSPFLVPENSVSIMDGTDEGVLAWITVNYLTGLLHGDHSVGILDLGGGSTQITFVPLHKATLDQTPGDFMTWIEMFANSYRLYTHSYLGFGLKAARLAVLGASVAAAQENQTFWSHCFPADLDAEWTFAGVTYRYGGRSDGLGGFAACYAEVQRVLQGKFHHVDEIHSTRFYAFSYYYDRAVDTSLIEREDGGELTVQDFAGKAQEVCDHMDGVPSWSPFLCMDLSYMTALLREGFGFKADTTLQMNTPAHLYSRIGKMAMRGTSHLPMGCKGRWIHKKGVRGSELQPEQLSENGMNFTNPT